MSDIDFLLDVFGDEARAPALTWRGDVLSFTDLGALVEQYVAHLARDGVGLGTPVILLGEFSFRSIALLCALIARRAIIIPLTPTTYASVADQLDDVAAQFILDARDGTMQSQPGHVPNDLYRILIERQTSGLVLFTSGSTGRPKIVVHDFLRLLQKFRQPRPAMVMLNFLLFDHWGGI